MRSLLLTLSATLAGHTGEVALAVTLFAAALAVTVATTWPAAMRAKS